MSTLEFTDTQFSAFSPPQPFPTPVYLQGSGSDGVDGEYDLQGGTDGNGNNYYAQSYPTSTNYIYYGELGWYVGPILNDSDPLYLSDGDDPTALAQTGYIVNSGLSDAPTLFTYYPTPNVQDAPSIISVTTTSVTVSQPALTTFSSYQILYSQIVGSGSWVSVGSGLDGTEGNQLVSGLIPNTSYIFMYLSAGDGGSINGNASGAALTDEYLYVTSAGVSGCNGAYAYSGLDGNSLPYFVLDSAHYIYSLSSGYWLIGENVDDDSLVYYYEGTYNNGEPNGEYTNAGSLGSGASPTVSSTAPSPIAPIAPTFVSSTQSSIIMTEPSLSLYSENQDLLISADSGDTWNPVFSGLNGTEGNQTVTGLSVNTSYMFEYVANGLGGSTSGATATLTTSNYPNYIAYGAGTPGYNGAYIFTGLDGSSNPYWQLDDSHVLCSIYSTFWLLTQSVGENDANTAYYQSLSSVTDPTGTYQSDSSAGIPPGPVIGLAGSVIIPPVVDTVTIDTTGLILTINWTVAGTGPVIGDSGLSLSSLSDGGATLSDVSTSSTTTTATISRAIQWNEIPTLSATLNNFTDSESPTPNPVIDFSGQAIRNNSTVNAVTYMVIDSSDTNFNGTYVPGGMDSNGNYCYLGDSHYLYFNPGVGWVITTELDGLLANGTYGYYSLNGYNGGTPTPGTFTGDNTAPGTLVLELPPTAPTFLSATIQSDGVTLIIEWNETNNPPMSGTAGLSLSEEGPGATLSDVSTTDTTTTATLSRAVNPDETFAIFYDSDTGNFENAADIPVVSFEGGVTNNSVTMPTLYVYGAGDLSYNGAYTAYTSDGNSNPYWQLDDSHYVYQQWIGNCFDGGDYYWAMGSTLDSTDSIAYYKIFSIGDPNSNPWAVDGATTPLPTSSFTMPSAPPQLTVTVTSGVGGHIVNWEYNELANSYNIYESDTSGGEGDTPVYTGVTNLSLFVFNQGNIGQRKYFKVSGVGISGEGELSEEFSSVVSGQVFPGMIAG